MTLKKVSTYPNNSPYQHILSTHPINAPSQPILSIHTVSTHPLNTPCQPTLSTLVSANRQLVGYLLADRRHLPLGLFTLLPGVFRGPQSTIIRC